MVEVRNITKRYGPFVAVEDIEFSVDKGQVLGFIGPNGAGKTTTMRILTGFLPATAGTAIVAGHDVFDEPMQVKRKVGYLPETPPLYLELTVGDYLRFCGELRGIRGAEADRRVGEVMDRVGLRGWERRITGSLSKGYRQRVGLAQALLHKPQVLILDEPTSGLDPAQVVGVRELIGSLSNEHTVILSTHILREVEALCSHVVVINKGKLAAKGTMEEVRESASRRWYRIQLQTPPEEAAAIIGSLNEVDMVEPLDDGVLKVISDVDPRPAIAQLCAQKSWGLIALERVLPTLEDAFLSLVGAET